MTVYWGGGAGAAALTNNNHGIHEIDRRGVPGAGVSKNRV